MATRLRAPHPVAEPSCSYAVAAPRCRPHHHQRPPHPRQQHHAQQQLFPVVGCQQQQARRLSAPRVQAAGTGVDGVGGSVVLQDKSSPPPDSSSTPPGEGDGRPAPQASSPSSSHGGGEAAAQPAAAPGPVEADDLRSQLLQLQSVMTAQQEVIQTQQALIEDLRTSVKPPELALAPSPSQQQWSASISPFDAQRIGIMDRRHLGLFDARFHSTNA